MRRILLSAVLTLAACTPAPVTPPKATPKPAGTKAPAASALPAVAAGTVRKVEAGVAMELTGKVRVISDYGLGLVSNNGGNLVAGAEARIVSNNGGAMIGKTKFFRLAAVAVPEDLVADATIEVLDAAGRVLQDAQGKPITATSDQTGSYTLKATLPAENLVLRVRLGEGGGLRGGELQALVAGKGAAGPLPVSLDTASSLGAAYVLGEYVKGQQAVLDRLPRANADALSAGMEAARARLPLTLPVYSADLLARAAADLRAQDAPLDATLDAIEAILLAGQSQLGEGLQATRVPLSAPLSLAKDAAGNLYVAESVAGRIRKIATDGTVTLFAGAGLEAGRRERPKAFDALFSSLTDILALPDGSFVVAEGEAHQVRRIGPDGKVTVVAGTGVRGQGAVGGQASETAITRPTSLALAPDGALLIGENVTGGAQARLLRVDAAGTITAATPPDNLADATISGVAYGADGTLFVATGFTQRVLALPPGQPWKVLVDALAMHDGSRLLAAPQGGVWVSEMRGHRVLHVAADGTKTVVAGTGQPGYAGDGGPAAAARLFRPAGLLALPDGRLAVADAGNMVIRAFDPRDPQQPMTTIAGTDGVVQQGDGTSIAVNGPAGLAIDPQDRVVFAELGGSTIKRLDAGKAQLLAGTSAGFADGPALSAQFNTPGGMAYDAAGALWVLDTVKPRLRRLTAAGVVETVVGTGSTGERAQDLTQERVPALAHEMGRPLFVTIGPDQRPYWTDNALGLVLRLNAAGEVERVAGALPAVFDKNDGFADGPAADAKFARPAGLAFDAVGDLYVADLGNTKIRKIRQPGTPGASVSTIAGKPFAETFFQLNDGPATQADGLPGAEASFFGPMSVAIDAEGRLLVGEIGTARIDALFPIPFLSDLAHLSPARVRRIDLRDPAFPVSTIVGPGTRALAEAYGDQSLGIPLGLTLDRSGRLIVADGANNQVKLIPKAAL